MRMDTMNQIFKERGFEVERKWKDSQYHFIISKNGFSLSDDFCYSGSEKDQVLFIEDMIKKFESLYPYSICIDDTYRCTMGGRLTNKTNFLFKKDRPLKTNIVKVIFNNPATIIKWTDGTKTVVKSSEEGYDPEKGLAMAIAKKALGNKGNYYNIFRQWLPRAAKKQSLKNGKLS